MKVIISAASRALLAAHVLPGRQLADLPALPDGRFEVDLDEEVFWHLSALDPDPDRAIAQLCSTGVGHA